jgi:hypothetical protein
MPIDVAMSEYEIPAATWLAFTLSGEFAMVLKDQTMPRTVPPTPATTPPTKRTPPVTATLAEFFMVRILVAHFIGRRRAGKPRRISSPVKRRGNRAK